MNRFSRDFALVDAKGRIIAESHDEKRLTSLQQELAQEGLNSRVVACDFPRGRA